LFEIGQGIATAWWQERPLPSEDVGYTLMSLQLDANQIPAIAYVNRATGYVMFARRQGKAWRTEAVEAAVTANITGGQASLAFDPQSVPHLAYVYIAGTHFKLHHAWKTSATTWATEAVDSTKDVSGVPAIACDASGNISIAYQERSGLDLKFARKAAGVWTVDPVVDATGNAGVAASIVLDALGDPHIGYATTVAPRQVRYAHKTASGWAIETVAADPSLLANENESTPIVLRPDGSPALVYFTSDGQGNDRLYYSGRGAAGWSSELISDLGSAPYPTHHSLAIAPNGIAHVAYSNGEGELTHAVRSSTGWHFDSFEEYGAGWGCTIVIDQQGLPRIAHFLYDVAAGYPYPGHPRYTSSAVEIGNPAPGTSWPVGARRTITWDGSGAADVSLSTDGGQNYVTVATAVSGGGYAVTVPNTPSDFCKIRVERAVPWSIAATDSFFKISAYVSAGVFVVTPVPDGDGAMATWHTEPGPEDLAGYKLLRSSPGEPWRTIMPLSRATTFLDQSPRDGSHYRLVAVNNLGDELEVGEQALAPLRNLAAWPLPYRGGNLDISFRIDGAVVAGVPVDIEVLDIAGRHLHTLANGVFTPGIHHVQWNGSATGVGSLPNGMYFLRRSSPAGNETVKFVVIR
jgi:hypothetical protein